MEIRSEKELLELMLNNQHLFISGLCDWNLSMYCKDIISLKECEFLEKIIQKHKPFLYHFSISAFYWEMGNITPRIKWIKKRIKRSKS